MQQNIYREFTWQGNHFTQLPFAGFYPVSSKTEAQILQQSKLGANDLPWHDPIATSVQMSKDLLQWSETPQSRLISQTSTEAVVELTRQHPQSVVNVTLKRLLQPNKNGLWFVTDARSPGLLLSEPDKLNQPLRTSVTSPIAFSGANVLIDGQTTVTLLDHTLTPLDQANSLPLNIRPDSTYTASLPYAHLLSGQQGVIVIRSRPLQQNEEQESEQILLRGVLLN
jgi:hypothetical protein